jgi:anti-sigma factor RsiW
VNHPRIRARLSQYLDRKLPPKQRSEIDAHLVECAACSAELHELERTVDLLRRLPDPEPPPYLAQAVMARLEAGEGQRELPMQRLRRLIGPAFATSVAVAVSGLFLFTLVDIEIQLPPHPATTGDPSPGVVQASSEPKPSRSPYSLARHHARRGESAEVALLLRGAGHPHSALLATHFEHDSEIALASW